jgi:hypothetical protein
VLHKGYNGPRGFLARACYGKRVYVGFAIVHCYIMNVAVLKDVLAGHESPKLVFKGLFVSGNRVRLALFEVCIRSWIINSVVISAFIAVFG